MLEPRIDHLVCAAVSLEAGADYIARLLGVRPTGGGEHVAMGTHNRVLRLGPDCYLEVIAINPNAPRPGHARWFALDTEWMTERLKERPRLVAWAVRTDRIENLAQQSREPLGPVQSMRRGDLSWRLTLPPGGALPGDGLIPFLIQWDREPPVSAMPESGCRLLKLCGRHPRPEAIGATLRTLGVEHLLELTLSEPGSAPELSALIETPSGPRRLGGPQADAPV